MLESTPDWMADRGFIEDLPFFPQDRYQCGPAALATVLVHEGVTTSPDALVKLVYVPELKGTLQNEMLAGIRRTGLLAYQLQPRLEDLISEVAAGNPVLVMQNLGLSWMPQWHYAVLKGYDLQSATLILNSGTVEDYSLSMRTFEKTWERADYWAVVALKPGQLAASARPGPYFAALVDFQHSKPGYARLFDSYQAGLAAWPDNRNLMMGLGNLELEQSRYFKAADIFTDVVRHYPQYGPAHNNLAMALLRLNNFDEASYHAMQALQSDDEFTSVYRETLSEIQQAGQ